jgi:hypothetical protein
LSNGQLGVHVAGFGLYGPSPAWRVC